MYPNGELARLAKRKTLLRARIDVHRSECAAAAVELSRPIALLDRALEKWQRISPFIKLLAVPAGIMLVNHLRGRRKGRGTSAKPGKMAAIMAALPMVLRGVKIELEARAVHSARQKTAKRGMFAGSR